MGSSPARGTRLPSSSSHDQTSPSEVTKSVCASPAEQAVNLPLAPLPASTARVSSRTSSTASCSRFLSDASTVSVNVGIRMRWARSLRGFGSHSRAAVPDAPRLGDGQPPGCEAAPAGRDEDRMAPAAAALQDPLALEPLLGRHYLSNAT